MSLKQLVNTYDVHQSFLSYLSEKIASYQRSLEQATSMEEVYRLQGQILALRRLMMLRDEVNATEK